MTTDGRAGLAPAQVPGQEPSPRTGGTVGTVSRSRIGRTYRARHIPGSAPWPVPDNDVARLRRMTQLAVAAARTHDLEAARLQRTGSPLARYLSSLSGYGVTRSKVLRLSSEFESCANCRMPRVRFFLKRRSSCDLTEM